MEESKLNNIILTFNDVSYIYDKKAINKYDALSHVSFSLEKGDFLAIVGKTGSGKSTLVQTINGLLLPTMGYTKVNDFYVTNDKKIIKELKNKGVKKKDLKKFAPLRKEVGMVFQFPEYQLFSETVLKDVMFGPKNFGFNEEEAKTRAIEALKEVGLNETFYEKSPFELSGGEKRRVAIAGIIASSPSILVLDEPSVGLDPNGKKEILSLIKKIHDKGTTVIIVTHDMDVVMECANKVVILKDSKFLEMTTPKELFNKDDISSFSLEIPAFYQFKRALKREGFKDEFLNEENEETLIKEFIKRYGSKF